MGATSPSRLQLSGITKSFGDLLANDHIDLNVAPGEIHAILGENGAGKSTLVKIIYGVLAADEGTVRWNGEAVQIPSPRAARALGIGMVFQHFSLFDSLTVGENVLLGLDKARSPQSVARDVRAVADRYGLALDPDQPLHELSVGERQRVEIVRCLLQEPQLIIMDEPTAVLTPQEAERLFVTLRALAAEQRSILYISHKLDEIQALCHSASIMRNGVLLETCDPNAVSKKALAEKMLGVSLPDAQSRASQTLGAAIFEVSSLSTHPTPEHPVPLTDIHLSVRRGEILGIAGLAGNGQQRLQALLSGEATTTRECIRFEGKAIGNVGVKQRRSLGIACIPEDRLGHGSVPDMSLTENALLTGYIRQPLTHLGWIRFAKAREFAERIIEQFGVKARGNRSEAADLSGGNLQKFIVGRELLQSPRVLVVSHPTWGIDAGAAITIRQHLVELAEGGAGVIIISQDLDELLEICDRIAVISGGKLSHAEDRTKLTLEHLGLLMGGDRMAPAADSRA